MEGQEMTRDTVALSDTVTEEEQTSIDKPKVQRCVDLSATSSRSVHQGDGCLEQQQPRFHFKVYTRLQYHYSSTLIASCFTLDLYAWPSSSPSSARGFYLLEDSALVISAPTFEPAAHFPAFCRRASCL